MSKQTSTDNADHSGLLLGGSIVLIAVPSTAVTLRLVSRRMKRLSWEADDYLIVVALTFAYAMFIALLFCPSLLLAVDHDIVALTEYQRYPERPRKTCPWTRIGIRRRCRKGSLCLRSSLPVMHSSNKDKHSMPLQKDIHDSQPDIRLRSLRGRCFTDRLGHCRFFHNGLSMLAD